MSIKKISDSTDIIENAFEGDFLGRKALADSLEGYVSRLQVGATIAIDAEWGAGKSWFVNHWKKQLQDHGYKVIYLNAFTQDYIEDPFLTISMEIVNNLDADKEKIDILKKHIGNVWRNFLPHAPMLLFTAISTLAGGGYFAQQVNEFIKDLKNSGDFSEQLGTILNQQLQEHLTAQIENYDKEKQTVEYFKKCLNEITQNQDKPIIFVVDELDRCKPEFSIRLIERIKHFFDVPKVVFVLSMNKPQLEESINSYYGFKSENKYLDKFLDATIILKHEINIKVDYDIIINNYASKLGLDFGGFRNIDFVIEVCKIFNPNARELVRIVNKYSFLLKDNYDVNQCAFMFLVLIMLELNKVEEINYNSFRNTFMKISNVFYTPVLKSYNASLPQGSKHYQSILDFMIYHKFLNTGLVSYLKQINFELKYRNKDSDGESLLKYYPNLSTDNNSKDLIKAWYDYIYMIGEFVE